MCKASISVIAPRATQISFWFISAEIKRQKETGSQFVDSYWLITWWNSLSAWRSEIEQREVESSRLLDSGDDSTDDRVRVINNILLLCKDQKIVLVWIEAELAESKYVSVVNFLM